MATAFAGPLSRWFGKSEEEAVRLRAGVDAWRDDLRSSVADKVAAQLEWDEASDVSHTADLGESGWIALRMFAFYAERSDLDWPDTVPTLPEFDPAWREAAEAKFQKSLYGQLLAGEIWLPGDFPVTIRAPRPDGDAAEIGSLKILRDQLQWLNQRTFQADQEVIDTWLHLEAPPGATFLDAAKRGYAALLQATETAHTNALPLLLDP